jgi:hypothetical protein
MKNDFVNLQKAAEQSVQRTVGILRHFRAFLRPNRILPSKFYLRPPHRR